MFWRSRRRREIDAWQASWHARIEEIRAAKPAIMAALEMRNALIKADS